MPTSPTPPVFDTGFQHQFETLLAWRRDVRRFKPDPLPAELLPHLAELAALSPSVGNSQPWRLVSVSNQETRDRVVADFKQCNAEALKSYLPGQADSYARLKLEGLQTAPMHLAVFSDEATEDGHGLGRQTMPETLAYSAVMAVHTVWLAARAQGVGVGWVSILDPDAVHRLLNVPPAWKLIAYLCIGWPVEDHLDPELERHAWQARTAACRAVLQR